MFTTEFGAKLGDYGIVGYSILHWQSAWYHRCYIWRLLELGQCLQNFTNSLIEQCNMKWRVSEDKKI